ncbi:MAG TPA: alanine racemase, partial [Clostridia bacterium]|nr:alanine racemase [Clostridia bacterium]
LRALAPGLPLHAANSAGLIRFPHAAYDWVRAGIALYGAPPMRCPVPLRQAMRWTTRASYVKTVPAGTTIGYGRTHVAGNDLRVMTLPIGYADGYLRALSNRAQVLVRGRRAPIIGRVCMDQCMADVTAIPDAAAGDEVVLLGRQGAGFIGADELAEWAGTISYEVMCAVSPRVTRTVLSEDGHA